MMKVTYLKHSGFLVETEELYLLFDYYKGAFPDWNRDKKMLVFVSHGHYDHFGKEIFRLSDVFREIRFILSSDIDAKEYEKYGSVTSVGAGQTSEIEGVTVRTLRSNDQGVAYLLHTGGKTIYHAGDLNWWHWEGEPERFNKAMRRSYQSEINKLKDEKIDVAFVPVDPRQGEQYCWGLDCFMKRTVTKKVFPMHFWENYEIFERLMLEACTDEYRNSIVKIEREGQTFLLES
nr:MBL fold metallo-hydrolase [uncultured Mediterraneibacter sp.]